MSTYALNKMLRDINRVAAKREQYFTGGAAAFSNGYTLTDDERRAFVEHDIGALYRLGAHGLLLRPFTLLHKMPEPAYLNAIRG